MIFVELFLYNFCNSHFFSLIIEKNNREGKKKRKS